MAAGGMRWALHGSCRGTDPNRWYPTGVGRPRKGAPRHQVDVVPPDLRALCEACPVLAQCLDHALHHEPYGIWAATSERQRNRMRAAAGIRVEALVVDDGDDSDEELSAS